MLLRYTMLEDSYFCSLYLHNTILLRHFGQFFFSACACMSCNNCFGTPIDKFNKGVTGVLKAFYKRLAGARAGKG